MHRRLLLQTPWALPALVGCQPRQLPPARWLGADALRGHALRTASKSGALPAPARQHRAGVLVLGGGVAGLSALRRLAERGHADAQLLELEDSVGGNSRGHSLGGMACPQGAHYLPVPGPAAWEVAAWLHDIGLLRSDAAGVHAHERHLCHAPQERLLIDGVWQDGLLPSAEGRPATLDQYRRFAQLVHALRQRRLFCLPTVHSRWTPELAVLDAQPFALWLAQQGLDDDRLLAYLDYACRDDYGAGLASVSAWAGLHYFASRHGFQVPGDEAHEREAVFTWPEGNAWLVRQLAEPLAPRLHTGRTVLRMVPERQGVTVLAWSAADAVLEAWHAPAVVVALPLFIASRLLADWADPLAAALHQAAARQQHAPWLVAHVRFAAPLPPGVGAPPSWDNLGHAPAGHSTALGYVDASHQSLRPEPGPTVLSCYHALPVHERHALLNQPAAWWAQRVLADLARLHPEAPGLAQEIDLSRWGHGMAIPSPGQRGSAALAALRAATGRIRFAHSDLVAYSVFEEAFTLGWLAAG